MTSLRWHSHKKKKPFIPDDVLLSNIFIQLPAKQIAQMRSLSKTWNSLLSRPSFIKSHLDRSIDTNDEILMVFDDSFLLKSKPPFTAHTSPDLQLTDLIKVHANSSPSSVVGSVHGLICLSSERCFKIWNPSLSALIDLPPFTIGMDNDNEYDYHFNFQFGFDPKMNDYKVVKLTFNVNSDNGIIYNCLPVEVFSVRKGSWESITERFPSHVKTVLNNNEVLVARHDDGRLHYLCGVDDVLQTIVAFDLGDETFSEIALPDCVQGFRRTNELGVLSQKLCVMSCVGNGDCEVWVMENYGVATSWVKRHVISKYDGDDIVPIGFTLNNQLVFGHGIHLALYDPEASTVRRFKGAKPFGYSATVAQYVDSLVWVTPPKCGIINDVCVAN